MKFDYASTMDLTLQQLRILDAVTREGSAGAAALSRLVEGMLFGVTSLDPATFVGVSVLLAAVALTACSIPARRATRLDPLVSLRAE